MIEIRSLQKTDPFDDLVSLSREFFHEYEAYHKDFFQAKGVKYCTVFTATENQGALSFYRQNGFVPLYTTMIGEIIEGQ
jgi:hypothetical protein